MTVFYEVVVPIMLTLFGTLFVLGFFGEKRTYIKALDVLAAFFFFFLLVAMAGGLS